jgi:hypothetical protein
MLSNPICRPSIALDFVRFSRRPRFQVTPPALEVPATLTLLNESFCAHVSYHAPDILPILLFCPKTNCMHDVIPGVEIGGSLHGHLGELARITKLPASTVLRLADRMSATDSCVLSCPMELAQMDTRARVSGVGLRTGGRGTCLETKYSRCTLWPD